jgi:hypothetical protein
MTYSWTIFHITLSNPASTAAILSFRRPWDIRDEAQLATEAINRVETQVTDVRTLSVQQEYFNLLAAGLLGLHYSSGMAEDGSTVRYAHTAEKLEDSAFAWMSGINGFFISTDGGKTWGHGWADTEKVVKLAVEAVGLSADSLIGAWCGLPCEDFWNRPLFLGGGCDQPD